MLVKCWIEITSERHMASEIDLPIAPFPGLRIGSYMVKCVYVCQLGDSNREIEVEVEGNRDVDILKSLGWVDL